MPDLDYAHRPSKAVTRRILVHTLRRLQGLRPLTEYAYVGFGAIQFLDFDMVHRHLGVTDMSSLEGKTTLLDRCNFNKPYGSIKVLGGSAGTLLPGLDWSRPTIVWLDYTTRLTVKVISDCRSVALVMQPGSVLAVTLNSDPSEEGERRSALERAVGSGRVPLVVNEAKLGGWGLAAMQREILTGEINQVMGARGDGTAWQQLLNIHYKDDARMQLVAGIVDGPEIHDSLTACRFFDDPETRSDAETLEVVVPRLTAKERHRIDQARTASPGLLGIDQDELDSYGRLYRWMDAVSRG